jgi:hypothetical protein
MHGQSAQLPAPAQIVDGGSSEAVAGIASAAANGSGDGSDIANGGGGGPAAAAAAASARAPSPSSGRPSPAVTGTFVVRLRGLPWQASTLDIEQFFETNKATARRVVLGFTPAGRPSGQGFVEFGSEAEFDIALGMNKQVLNGRYIEIFPSSADDMEASTAKPRAAAHAAPSVVDSHAQTPMQYVVRLRGLPFSYVMSDPVFRPCSCSR